MAARVNRPGYCSSLLSSRSNRERRRRRPGKAADDVAFADFADLFGVRLDDGLADRELAVAADHHLAALADRQNRGAVPDRQLFSDACMECPRSGQIEGWRRGLQSRHFSRIPVTMSRDRPLQALSRSSQGDIGLLKGPRFRRRRRPEGSSFHAHSVRQAQDQGNRHRGRGDLDGTGVSKVLTVSASSTICSICWPGIRASTSR